MENKQKNLPRWLIFAAAAAVVVLAVVLGLLLTQCSREEAPPETSAPAESTGGDGTDVRTLEDVTVPAPMFPGKQETELTYVLDPAALFADGITGSYTVVCDDASAGIAEAEKAYLLTFTGFGDKRITVTRTADGRQSEVRFTLKVTPQIGTQILNGDFESGYNGWLLTEEEKAAYAVYDSPTDIWDNPVGAANHYLYGYADEAYADAAFPSSLFKLEGTGIITWKMAGNCTENLQFILMKYNENGEDEQIAAFNNWYFNGSNESGFIFRQYFYQADMERYGGSVCYFLVKDNSDGALGFGFLCLDDIVTYYETAPDTLAMLEAGFCVKPGETAPDREDTSNQEFPDDLSGTPNQLPNGDFESGYNGWYMTAEEKAAYAVYDSAVDIWGNPVNANGHYLYGYANEAYASADFHSSLFKVSGSGVITWKMAGNCTEDLQFILMKYNKNGEDEQIAVFNNWYFAGANESGFILHDYYYQIDLDAYRGAYCYFVVRDSDDGSAGFGFVNLDDIVTYYKTAPNTELMLPGGFCRAPEQEKPSDPTPPADEKIPCQLPNGDFESGYDGWNMTVEEKLAYSVYDSPVDIWGNPVGATNHYLYGYANEAFANANFSSGLFKVSGSGVITWKMAGNCTEDLQFILMKYNENGEDEQIAVFNNWYFGTAAESGFIFHTYFYQLDMEKYADALCYFVVKDSNTGANGFGFICLDDIVTYYETAPDTSAMLPGGYCVRPQEPEKPEEPDQPEEPSDDPDAKDFPDDLSSVGNQLVNGDFESGYEGWYMTDEEKAAYPIIDSVGDLWGNPVGATGHYLYGFGNESFANANFYSGLFKVGGSGVITWKMAGNCTEDLQFILMKYNPEAEDEQIAVFNNWYFGTVAESGFIFHSYYYQLDMRKYADSYCYFIVKDTMSANFAFICLDDIVTYYETAPDTSAMLPGGFCTRPVIQDPDAKDFGGDLTQVGNQLVNGDFESGYEGWYMTDEEKAAYTIIDSAGDLWGNPVGATDHYLYGYGIESFANANFYSGLFKVGGSGVITWKMAGNCTEDLQFILMKYNPEAEDEQIAVFNNWYFGTVAESGFIFHSYYYQLDMSKYADSYCYFVVKDTMSAYFAFICLDDIVTYYETAPDTSAMLPGGFCTRPVIQDPDAKDFGGDLTQVGNQLVNGDFESGYEGWYMTDEEKAAYPIIDSADDLWGNPVGATDHYLYGYGIESFANANFYSGLFKVGGSGVITWKMAGNCTENLQFILMQYDPEGPDTEIARFNNWYFGTVAESGFIFHSYYYQLDMSKYADSYCYFIVKDTMSANFAFICLDDIVTYYETAPDVSGLLKGGYCTEPEA